MKRGSAMSDSIPNDIPHREIIIDPKHDNRGMPGLTFNYRELHICDSGDGACKIVLKVNRVYYGRPAEGGYMEGYVFSEEINAPGSDLQLTDEELKDKYIGMFPDDPVIYG